MFELKTEAELVKDCSSIECIHKVSFRYEPYSGSENLITAFQNKNSFFYNKKALIFISVGQDYHEGSKFLSLIHLLNRQNFARCDIMLADTLQRHNFMLVSEEEAHNYTKKSGYYWLQRHAAAIDLLKVDHSITHWDDLLQHQEYLHYRSLVEKEFEKNDEYRNAIFSNVETYLERLQKNNSGVDIKNIFNNGLRYLIEELPIVMPIWAKMGYDFIIYPKPITPAMRKTYELFVKNNFDNKCNWLYLRFKKK